MYLKTGQIFRKRHVFISIFVFVGYTLIAKLKPQSHSSGYDTQPFMDFVTVTFPGSVLKDVHQGMLHFHIIGTRISWSAVFGILEKAKDKFELEDYMISQTTLEQVCVFGYSALNVSRIYDFAYF